MLASTQTAVHLAELLDGTSIDMSMLDQTLKEKVVTGNLSMLDPSLKKKLDEILMNKTLVKVESISSEDAALQLVDLNSGQESKEQKGLRCPVPRSSGRCSSVAMPVRAIRGSNLEQSVFEEEASGFFVDDEVKVDMKKCWFIYIQI